MYVNVPSIPSIRKPTNDNMNYEQALGTIECIVALYMREKHYDEAVVADATKAMEIIKRGFSNE